MRVVFSKCGLGEHLSGNASSMLLCLPVPFRQHDGETWVESQAANGCKRWADNFEKVTVAAPVIPESQLETNNFKWVRVQEQYEGLSVHSVELPWGYGLRGHRRNVCRVRELIAPLIRQHRYLQFAIGGCLFGDWAAEAARIAKKLNRAYAVHTDWVTHRVAISAASRGPKGVYRYLEGLSMRAAERRIIEHASLGLFHGADTFEFYRKWCSNPQLVHDVHVSGASLPSSEDVAAKSERVLASRPLRIIYAGRVAAMKGPEYWVRAMAALHAVGVDFEATWYGDGPELEKMATLVKECGLQGHVSLPGQAEHGEIVQELRRADVLVFCHMTPESPRILIESLNQATPIVGFCSPYPQDLIRSGGGVMVPRGDVSALAEALTGLSGDRSRLSELTREAGVIGRELTDDAVFRERSDLIKMHLP